MYSVSETIINKNTKDINKDDVKVYPCGTGVLLSFYDKNPYRLVETSDTGLILGIESTKKYKSNETGEIEDVEELVACAKVIAIGSACRDVKVGDDVFANKHLALPVPFRKKGYMLLDERNVLCRITND